MGKTDPERTKDSALAALTQNIYRLMDSRGISRNRLAAEAGMDDTSFYRKLDRRPQTFTAEDLLGIANALGVAPSALWKEAA